MSFHFDLSLFILYNLNDEHLSSTDKEKPRISLDTFMDVVRRMTRKCSAPFSDIRKPVPRLKKDIGDFEFKELNFQKSIDISLENMSILEFI